jgi:hypothetical protein
LGVRRAAALATITGVNARTCRIRATGNINLFQLGQGDIDIGNLYLEAEAPQSAGAATDFSHGFSANVRIHDLLLGSNFFNGLYIVGNASNPVIGGIHLQKIYFSAIETGVQKYGKAAIAIGSSSYRTVGVQLADAGGIANATSDMPRWLELNNCDSVFGTLGGFQNGTEGLTVGNADSSANKTTNLSLAQFWFDTMSALGIKLENNFASEFTACHSQGGEVYGQECHGGGRTSAVRDPRRKRQIEEHPRYRQPDRENKTKNVLNEAEGTKAENKVEIVRNQEV